VILELQRILEKRELAVESQVDGPTFQIEHVRHVAAVRKMVEKPLHSVSVLSFCA